MAATQCYGKQQLSFGKRVLKLGLNAHVTKKWQKYNHYFEHSMCYKSKNTKAAVFSEATPSNPEVH